jgi:hypothetical protein
LLGVEDMPDAQRGTFVLKLGDLFDVLRLVCKDDSLIAVELGHHFNCVTDSVVLLILVGCNVSSA